MPLVKKFISESLGRTTREVRSDSSSQPRRVNSKQEERLNEVCFILLLEQNAIVDQVRKRSGENRP